MKTEEIRRRYAAGDRDFSKANLRGQNFKGQDLSGANFSRADIRGANFNSANLSGANFAGATAGLQKRWMIAQLIAAFLLSIGLSFFAVILNGGFAAAQLASPVDALTYLIKFKHRFRLILFLAALLNALAVVGIDMIVPFAIARQGFTPKARWTILVAIAFAGVIALAGAGASIVANKVVFANVHSFAELNSAAFSVPYILSNLLPLAVPSAIAFAFTVVGAIATAIAVAISDTFAVVGAIIAMIVLVVFVGGLPDPQAGILAIVFIRVGTLAVAMASLLLGIYASRRANQGDEKFASIRMISVGFGAIGGTNFRNANLTEANFSGATLTSTNFNGATLTRTDWTNAKKLDRARVGNSILSNVKVRELLVTGNGYSKNYEGCDFRGANLTGATLHKANLKWADLGEATLHKTDLREANLTEVLALETDFTEAALTGACLEGWNIDQTTKLDRVDCQYVFLREHPNAIGDRERRPPHPDQVLAKGTLKSFIKR